MTYTIDPRLANDTLPVGNLPLSEVRLMNDRTWPWLVLIPRQPGLIEIVDLDAAGRVQLMEEIAAASAAIQALHKPDKLNIGALGNVVRQLHVHVIGRWTHDPAGAGPVWGKQPPVAYDPASAALERAHFAKALKLTQP